MEKIRRFVIKAQAQEKISELLGWDAWPIQLILPDPEDPTKPVEAWAIAARRPGSTGDPMYLRESGYIS